MDLVMHEGPPGSKKVALKQAISAKIDDARIAPITGADTSIWEITCREPHNDDMRRADDLAVFRRIVRRTLDRIKDVHGFDIDLSVFPAVPVSCAIEFGRVWQPKAHPAFAVFGQAGAEGFVFRRRIAN
ncbi:MAG: SAVED domain-containing protein [Hyphomicrobiales bacterium]|nr:SAVED domain-containing protein [Hyphomicrobiales bacterium]